MHIGVIPARAGSQRFPGKNRARIDDKPLWSIAVETAQKAKLDRVIINSDDLKIMAKATCEKYERPENLRDGQSYRIDDVMIEMAQKLDLKPDDRIHLIQCTSPFITYIHVDMGRRILDMYSNVDSAQLVVRVPNSSHAYSQRINVEGSMKFKYPTDRNKCFNSQKKPDHYIFCGYVAFKVASLLKNKNIWGKNSLPIIGVKKCGIDIDTPEDLDYAEYIWRKTHAS
jgi:CMP-N-acetylneuraminic acid synthetase